jgi:hypothetical protein
MSPGGLREGQGTEGEKKKGDAKGQRFKKPSEARC